MTMQRIIVLGFVIATCLIAPAYAQTPYDGLWNVTILTKAGSCEPSVRYPLTVTDGKVPARVNGTANPLEFPAAAVGKHRDSNDKRKAGEPVALARGFESRVVSADRGETNRKTFMTTPAVRNDIRIDRACSAAICEEIGDRLRIKLPSEPNRLPQRMMMLVDQMAADQRSVRTND